MNLRKKYSFLKMTYWSLLFLFLFCLFLKTNEVFSEPENKDNNQTFTTLPPVEKPVDDLFKNANLHFYSDKAHTQEIGKVVAENPQANEFVNTSESLQQRCDFLNNYKLVYDANGKQLTSRAFNENGSIKWDDSDTYDKTYNNQGELINEIKYQNNGVSPAIIEEYNNQGKKVKTTSFKEGGIKIDSIDEYDPQNGELTKETAFRADGQKIDYTSEYIPETGKLTKETQYKDDGQTIDYTLEYKPETGQLTKQSHYKEDGKTNIILEYDQATGNRVTQTNYQQDGQTPLIIVNFNEQGKKIKATAFRADGQTIGLFIEYDTQTGKQTKLTKLKVDGETPSIVVDYNEQGQKIKNTYYKNEANIIDIIENYDPSTGNITTTTHYKENGEVDFVENNEELQPETLSTPNYQTQNPTENLSTKLTNKSKICINEINPEKAKAAIFANNPELQSDTTFTVSFIPSQNFVVCSSQNYSNNVEVLYEVLNPTNNELELTKGQGNKLQPTTVLETNTTTPQVTTSRNTSNSANKAQATTNTNASNSENKTQTPPKSAWLWLTLSVVLALVVCGGSYYYYYFKKLKTKNN